MDVWYDQTNNKSTDYDFDAVGNVTSVKEKVGAGSWTTLKSFSYNAGSQITNSGYSFDSIGNLTSDTVQKYTYDSENRLKRVNRKSDGSEIANYAYDYQGKRIYQNVKPNTFRGEFRGRG